MRIRPVSLLLLLFMVGAAALSQNGATRAGLIPAQDPAPQDPGQDQYPDQGGYQNFSPEQLDNLLAPIALYPDPLLAQVLLAATFPDQIDEASRFVRGGGPPDDIDNQNWDVSVKAVARYPTVLDMMANRLDWTTSLGQAYVNQSTDVEESIQRLRDQAHNAGTLDSSPQLQVVQQDGSWCIWPAQPQFIYVPVYDPAVVFFGRPGWWRGGPFITFGVGYPIGAWFIYDFDWGRHRIYYHGWEGHLAPWAVRCRPYVRVTNVYVSERYRTVTVNRTVVNRRVNVENLNRYNSVHRDVRYTNVAENNLQHRVERNNPPVNNQVIQRNINPNDGRMSNFRGRETPPPHQETRPQPPPERPQPPPQRGPEVRPQPAPQRGSAYDVNPRPFTPQQSSSRGQYSRQEMSRPPAPARSAPQMRPSAPAPRGGGGGRRP